MDVNLNEKKALNPITICACVSRSFINGDKVAEIAAALKNSGYKVNIEADLCKKVLQNSPDMQEISTGTILACYPRAVQSLLDWINLEASSVVDIRNQGVEEVLSLFDISSPGENTASDKEKYLQEMERFPVEKGTDVWFPVIDKSKCTNCGKCHDFCLFGVYLAENKKVVVSRPENCKNNCPACARMCPSKAIVFPKYEKSPINGGTVEEEIFNPSEMEDVYKEKVREYIKQRRAKAALLKKKKK